MSRFYRGDIVHVNGADVAPWGQIDTWVVCPLAKCEALPVAQFPPGTVPHANCTVLRSGETCELTCPVGGPAAFLATPPPAPDVTPKVLPGPPQVTRKEWN